MGVLDNTIDDFYGDLGNVPNNVVSSVQRYFSREDAANELLFVKTNILEWLNEPQYSHTLCCNLDGVVEMKRIRRKDIGFEKLPRTLTFVRKWDSETYCYRALHILVHFNKRVWNDERSANMYEGCLGTGSHNIVKVLYDLKNRVFFTIRRPIKQKFNEKAHHEYELQRSVNSEHIEKAIYRGFYTKEGAQRIFTVHRLANFDADFYGTIPKSFQEKVAFTIGLVQGAKDIHDSGIAHNDYKPDNIVLVDGIPLIIDFGIATKNYKMLGYSGATNGFFPPNIESFADLRNGDKWALGVTISDVLDLKLREFQHRDRPIQDDGDNMIGKIIEKLIQSDEDAMPEVDPLNWTVFRR